MNDWRARSLCALVFFLAMLGYSGITSGLPNTPGGMLVFHGGAAAVDFLLLYCVPYFLNGRLAFLIETSCLVSIIWNFVGWLAYMAYSPPLVYNAAAWGLSYVQWCIILLVDRHDINRLGFGVVRGACNKGQQPYFTEAN